jgi:hypothetical protein
MTTITPANASSTAKHLFPISQANMLPNQEYYPDNWPYDMPFHPGEVALQHESGTHQSVMSYAPRVIRPYLPDQHTEFYQAQPFVVAAARDDNNNMWATLLFNHAVIAATTAATTTSHDRDENPAKVDSPDPITLELPRQLVTGDALDSPAWGQPGMDVGLLGIDFSSARRNRVNGILNAVSSIDKNVMSMHVTQSFGNCPQYIPSRAWWSANDKTNDDANKNDNTTDAVSDTVIVGTDGSTLSTPVSSVRSDHLSVQQIAVLQQADTIFVATGYRGDGDDVRFGNDASHRGGPAGFVKVSADGKTVTLPEFKGNNHFNSLGNLMLDSHMGITVALLERGSLLQVTGMAVVDMDTELASALWPGALRTVTLTVTQVNQLADNALPIRWGVPASARARDLKVVAKVPESAVVTSFYLEPTDGEDLWDFEAGNHLPIRLVTTAGDLQRTYSLSVAPSASNEAGNRYYRISVKREPEGKASSFLHDQIQVGNIIQARKPAGDFVLQERKDSSRAIVLLSTGIGVTPVLSMLQHLVQLSASDKDGNSRKIVWLHGARDGTLHAFREEIDELVKQSPSVEKHVVYSLPREQDRGLYDFKGRINAQLVQKLVPDLENADYYMCGPGAFMASLEGGLERLGVDSNYIHYETF